MELKELIEKLEAGDKEVWKLFDRPLVPNFCEVSKEEFENAKERLKYLKNKRRDK